MHRSEVNQRLLDLHPSPAYLEIGVCEGYTFHEVRAPRKVAVDPEFRFDVAAARANPANASAVYHVLPSDDYFTGPGRDDRFDVIFVDGLHTFDQTLRDLLHAMDRLNPGGAIVLDDVMPVSYSAALPSMADCDRLRAVADDGSQGWMGDVYRLVFFIRDYLTSWSYATVAENHGETILWRETRTHATPPLDVEKIARLEYRDVVIGRDAFNIRPFAEIEADIRRWRTASGY